jgi:hypothetical protein
VNRSCLLLAILLAGCSASVDPPGPPSPPSSPVGANHFDASACGTITGDVRWAGAVPRPPGVVAPRKPADYQDRSLPVEWPNPNTPVVEPTTKGVREAVVFLRGVDPARARPWDWPPVRVEIADTHLSVLQGETRGKVGFVRQGDAVEFVSREALLHLVRARGAACFSQPLTQAGTVRSRTMDRPGYVELSSGAGYFWMRGHLFVADHPCFAVTDERGRFTLPSVPAGEYEIVAWLPNWRETDHDRSGDTGYRTATRYAEPLTRTQRVTVRTGQATAVQPFVFSAE